MPLMRSKDQAMKVDGACHCGEIAYQAEVDPNTVGSCNCTDCQTLTGSAYRANIPASLKRFRLLKGKPNIYIKTADSGAKRAPFCPKLRHARLRRGDRRPLHLLALCWLNQATHRPTPQAADMVPFRATVVDGSEWDRETRATVRRHAVQERRKFQRVSVGLGFRMLREHPTHH
jgi:hypothetical protein